MSRARPRRGKLLTLLGTTQILGWGSSYYLPAVLADLIVADTGWRLPWVVGGLSLGLLVAGVASPRVGRAIDGTGGRPVLAAGSVLLGAGLAALALAPSLPAYLAAWVLIGLGMGAGLYDAVFALLGRLYGRDARAAITSVTLFGGFASTVCWPLSALLVETVGWRGTCLAYAGLHLALALPLHLALLPRAVPASLLPTPATPSAGAMARADAPSPPMSRRCAVLVLLGAALTLGSAVQGVISVHLLTLLQARGLDLAAAVALGALIGPSQVGARAVEKVLGGRYHPAWTMLASVVLAAIGLGLLWAGLLAPAIGVIAYGAGVGIGWIARGTLPLALFGAVGYATLMGRLAMPMWVATALAPWAGSFLLGEAGAAVTLAVLAGAAVGNVLLVVALLLLVRRTLAAAGP